MNTEEYIPQTVPIDILNAIFDHERERLGLTLADLPPICTLRGSSYVHAAYFPHYSTSMPGYVGPVVIILWESDPGAVSTFILKDGAWIHCNSTAF